MFIVDLECENGHEFEGHYSNQAEYQGYVDNDEVTCPYCKSNKVRNVLTTGAPITSKSAARQQQEAFEWVGERFADEAIAQWHGEKPGKNLLGTAEDPENRKKLVEAGVPVVKVVSFKEPQDSKDIN